MRRHLDSTRCSKMKCVQCSICTMNFPVNIYRKWEIGLWRKCLNHFIECWQKRLQEYESTSDAVVDIDLGEEIILNVQFKLIR